MAFMVFNSSIPSNDQIYIYKYTRQTSTKSNNSTVYINNIIKAGHSEINNSGELITSVGSAITLKCL